MRFSLAKEIFGQPWQIESSYFQQFLPFAVGMLNGSDFIPENEPVDNLPFYVDPFSAMPLQWTDDDDPDSDDQSVEEKNEKVVHVLPVRGLMLKHDQVCGPVGTRTLAQRLREADAKESVLGHVLIFETGGGTANSVPELADAILSCKKAVIAYVDGMMCSAGQYAGSYCTEIIASRETDLVGSIGTMIVYEGRKAISENDGVVHLRIYADEATEKNQEYEQAINDLNVKLVKERTLNPHNQQFTQDIKDNRKMVKDEHLHGATFQAKDVLGALVDSIGDFAFAVERVVYYSGHTKEEPSSQNAPASSENENPIFNSMKYTRIMSALGLDNESFVLEADGCRTFSPEELATMDNALASDQSNELNAALTETQSQLEAANNTIQQNDQRIQQLEQQNTENTAQIEQLQQEVNQLRGNAAEPPALVKTESNSLETNTDDKPISSKFDNPFDALEEVAEHYYGKKIQ